MSATIELANGEVCTLDDDLVWTCARDEGCAAMLNGLLPMLTYGGGDDPNPPYTVATQTLQVLEGKLIAFDPTEIDELVPPTGGD